MDVSRTDADAKPAAGLRKVLGAARDDARAGHVEMDVGLAARGLDEDDLTFDVALAEPEVLGADRASPSCASANRSAVSGGRKFIAGLPTKEATKRSTGRR